MPRKSTDIKINCINCGQTISLNPNTYRDYQGEIKCNDCNKNLQIEIEGDQLVSSPKIINEKIKILNLPKKIGKDLNEAHTCFQNKSYKACVVMCRRTLEQICQDKNANGNSLFAMIRDLTGRGVLSQDMEEIVTKIRIFGNYGAHPKNDLLGDLKRRDAKQVFDITVHTARHIYDVPDILSQLRNRRR